jgi:hypothetical protein
MTAADLAGQMPQRADTTLQADEIDALADYVAAKIKEAGPVTKAECLAYFGPGVQRCDRFPDTKAASSHRMVPVDRLRPRRNAAAARGPGVQGQRLNTYSIDVFCMSLHSGDFANMPRAMVEPPIRMVAE